MRTGRGSALVCAAGLPALAATVAPRWSRDWRAVSTEQSRTGGPAQRVDSFGAWGVGLVMGQGMGRRCSTS
jgi:hypothetical protein